MDLEEGEVQENELAKFEDDSTDDEINEAKSLGWKHPSEWKGSPPKNGFVKASEYVKRGETVIPIIKSQNAKLEKALADSKKELADFKAEQAKTFDNLSRMSKAALERQREQIEEKYAASIDAATEVGDKEAVRKLRKEEREDLKKFDDAAKDEPAKKDDKKTGDLPEEVTAWVKDNSWFEDDEDMKAVAINHHGKLLRDHPNWSLDKNLAEVRKYIEKRFPAEFKDESKDEDEDEKPKRRGSPVEGGGSRGGEGGTRTAWSKLPTEAQKQADRFIKEDKLFLNKGETAEKDLQKARERYAVEYLGEEK